MDLIGYMGLAASGILILVGMQSGDPEARVAVFEMTKCMLPLSLGFIAVGRLGTIADHLSEVRKELKEMNNKIPKLPDSGSSKEKGK